MGVTNSRLALVAVSVAVVAAGAGITLVVTTLLGLTFQGSDETPQENDSQLVEGRLTTANRDRLAICVEAVDVDPSVETSAKSAIEAALPEVAKHPHWDDSGLGVASPVVDIGCPSSAAALRPGVTVTQLGEKGVHVEPFPIVEKASYYALFVFILPPAELERVFGEAPETKLAAQEFYQGGDQYVGVTTGMYLTPSDLDDTQLLVAKLERAVGLTTR